MNSPIRFPLACAVLSLTAIASLHAEPLKVKPGLWETTTQVEKKGGRHPTNLDSLNSEQRAKVERELATRAKKETRTVRSCLRESQILNGEAFLGHTPHRQACSRKVESQTATRMVARLECRGANPMQGQVEMKAPDPEHMNGLATMTYGAPERMQLMTRTEISARWVSADCSAASGQAPRSGAGRER